MCKPGEEYPKLLKKYGQGTKEENVPINVPINVPVNVPIKLEKIIRDRLLSMDYAQKKIERAIQIVSIIADNKNVSMEDIAKNIGVNSRTIKRDIDALKEIGVLDREGSRKTGQWIISMNRHLNLNYLCSNQDVCFYFEQQK